MRDWDILPIVTATICQAVRDAQDPDPLRRLDAVSWLAGDAALWLEACGLSGEIGDLARAAKRLERAHYKGRAGIGNGAKRTKNADRENC